MQKVKYLQVIIATNFLLALDEVLYNFPDSTHIELIALWSTRLAQKCGDTEGVKPHKVTQLPVGIE